MWTATFPPALTPDLIVNLIVAVAALVLIALALKLWKSLPPGAQIKLRAMFELLVNPTGKKPPPE